MAEKFWNPKEKEGGSKISNTEWGMVISLLGIIDAIQFGLDWIGIPFIANVGTIANRLIDVVVGFAWPTYLYLRGINLKSVKTIGSILLTFFLEEIPDVDALPFWVADGVFVMSVTKAEEKIKEETGVDVEKAAALAEGKAEGEAGAAEADGENKPGGESGETGEESDGSSEEKGKDEEKKDENENEESEEEKEREEGGIDEEENEEEELSRSEDNEGEKMWGENKKEETLPVANPNRLDLRGETDKETSRIQSDPRDLSLSYGARKKERERNLVDLRKFSKQYHHPEYRKK